MFWDVALYTRNCSSQDNARDRGRLQSAEAEAKRSVGLACGLLPILGIVSGRHTPKDGFVRQRQKRKTFGRRAGSQGEDTRLDAFARLGAREEGFVPCDLGCLDCRGVLYVTALGDRRFPCFQCRVGHAHSYGRAGADRAPAENDSP